MEGGSPTVGRRRVGRALRDLRRRAGLTGHAAAAAVERSASWISRVEGGRVGLRGPDLRLLLDVYGMRDPRRRRELEELAREGKQRGWWSRYTEALPEPLVVFIGLESAATSIMEYDERIIPGLLQTERYCRATLQRSVAAVGALSAHELETRVRVRMERQAHLERDPPMFQIVLDEAVLYRTVGGREVLGEQLDHLLVAAGKPHVDLRVVPFAHGEKSVAADSYTIMTFRDDPAVMWHETPLGMTYEDDDNQVSVYRRIFQLLTKAALDVKSTVTLIRKARERLS